MDTLASKVTLQNHSTTSARASSSYPSDATPPTSSWKHLTSSTLNNRTISRNWSVWIVPTDSKLKNVTMSKIKWSNLSHQETMLLVKSPTVHRLVCNWSNLCIDRGFLLRESHVSPVPSSCKLWLWWLSCAQPSGNLTTSKIVMLLRVQSMVLIMLNVIGPQSALMEIRVHLKQIYKNAVNLQTLMSSTPWLVQCTSSASCKCS